MRVCVSHPSVAVDGSGNVFVAAASQGASVDYATIKYSNAGVPLWTNRYDGPGNNYGSPSDDAPSSLALDSSGNVFVTGGSGRITNGAYFTSYATVAYSSAGMPLWTNRYAGPGYRDHRATAIAVDGGGNVFVTGTSGGNNNYFDYATIKYSNAGVALWTNRYNEPGNYSAASASAVAVDGSGNVLVTGWTSDDPGIYGADYATIKYSGVGVPLWTNRYSGSGNSDDRANAVAMDGSGNVFVTGYSFGNGSGADYATVKYSNAGVPLWTNRYNGPENSADNAYALAVDRSGNVFVTGSSMGNRTGADYVTIKYASAGGPLLTIALTTTNMLALSWPSPAADFTLQQNANMSSANWTAVGITPADDGTNKTVIVEPPLGNRFYRLARP